MKKTGTKKVTSAKLKLYIKRLQVMGVILVLALGITPLLMSQKADAAQITLRKVTASTGVPSASDNLTFAFTTATSGFALDGIKLIACQTAIGTYTGGSCTIPTGFSFATGTYGSISGFTVATAFTIDTAGANDCIATAHPEVLCLKRSSGSNDTAGAKTLVINAVTNPSTANSTYYIGITTYNANTWPGGGRQDTGTVAGAVVQSLQVAAVIAEVLQFCAGTTSVDNATTAIGPCTTPITGTSVNIGTLDPTAINVSPVSANGGSNTNGVLVLRTNATNGTTVSYNAIQAGSGTNHLGTLRITGAACNAGNVSTDGCIDAQGGTQGTFTAGSEKFGMTVAGTNCGTASTYYTCVYTSASEHLVPSTNYVGATGAYGTTNGYAWVETSGTFTQIASAASSNTVGDEALILKFAATPSITTPFGSYTVQADFVAVPTY